MDHEEARRKHVAGKVLGASLFPAGENTTRVAGLTCFLFAYRLRLLIASRLSDGWEGTGAVGFALAGLRIRITKKPPRLVNNMLCTMDPAWESRRELVFDVRSGGILPRFTYIRRVMA